jgi:FMN phosphatase YigB (HAD superfamily)
MAVYVDNARIPFGRMLMCHMIADTTEELLAMARKIGVQTKWLQHHSRYSEHFDVCLSKRQRALQSGAIEITQRELAIALRDRMKGKW